MSYIIIHIPSWILQPVTVSRSPLSVYMQIYRAIAILFINTFIGPYTAVKPSICFHSVKTCLIDWYLVYHNNWRQVCSWIIKIASYIAIATFTFVFMMAIIQLCSTLPLYPAVNVFLGSNTCMYYK